MSHPSLRLAAARFVLELATTEELIDAAHEALNDGIYSYSLGELATLREPMMAEARPLFVAAMRELNMVVPNVDDAMAMVLLEFAGDISEGVLPPEGGMNECYHQFVSFTFGRVNCSEESRRHLSEFMEFSYNYEVRALVKIS